MIYTAINEAIGVTTLTLGPLTYLKKLSYCASICGYITELQLKRLL